MPRFAILTCLFCAFGRLLAYGDNNVAAIRFAHYEVLSNQYAMAAAAEPTKQLVREFVPKFLALANEDPTDETALRCCEWVIAHCRSHKDDSQLYDAEAFCWDMVGNNLSDSERLPDLCLEAARYPTPARERFLRELPKDYRQPVEVHGHSFLALAELLENKRKMARDSHVLDETAPAEWRQYLGRVDVVELRRESLDLYHHVLTHYAEVPYKLAVKCGKDSETLGDVAAKRLKQPKNNQLARKS
jgi:hypothetical protein